MGGKAPSLNSGRLCPLAPLLRSYSPGVGDTIIVNYFVLYRSATYQGGVILILSALRSVTMVKAKVNGQLEIFAIVNNQATKSL